MSMTPEEADALAALLNQTASATISARRAGAALCGLRGLTHGPGAVLSPARPPCCVPATM